MTTMDFNGTVLMFDVDGVLTDEHARVDERLIAELRPLCDAGAQLAFITGRSRVWLEKQLWPALMGAGLASDSPSLRFAAEMGALRRGQTTGFRWQVSPEHAVPGVLREELRSLPSRRRLDELIEWDASKEATATFESLHRPDEPGFAARARDGLATLFEELQGLAAQFGCRAAMSTYALDVLAPKLTKRVGAEFALHDIGALSVTERIFVFGDSVGDLAMAETARDLTSAKVVFLWVGRGDAPSSNAIDVRPLSVPHSEGTLLALQLLRQDVL